MCTSLFRWLWPPPRLQQCTCSFLCMYIYNICVFVTPTTFFVQVVMAATPLATVQMQFSLFATELAYVTHAYIMSIDLEMYMRIDRYTHTCIPRYRCIPMYVVSLPICILLFVGGYGRHPACNSAHAVFALRDRVCLRDARREIRRRDSPIAAHWGRKLTLEGSCNISFVVSEGGDERRHCTLLSNDRIDEILYVT